MTSQFVAWYCLVSLVTFSFWYKFYVSIMTGSGIMIIRVYKGLTRNPDIENTLVWVLSNTLRLEQVKDTKVGTNTLNKKLLNAAKCQDYSFYRFWCMQKPGGGGGGGGGGLSFPNPPRSWLRWLGSIFRIERKDSWQN